MRKEKLFKSLFVMMLCASPLVGADTQYPASDFKPTVQYQDADYIAANKQSTQGATSSSTDDAQYPATNFKPKVLFKDSDYKHVQPNAGASKQRSSAAAVVRAEINEETSTLGIADKKEESGNTALIGLVVLAVAGFFFMNKRSGASVPASRTVRSVAAASGGSEGQTGVARYLKQKEIASATGVAKYLEKKTAEAKVQVATEVVESATGVAKYLEKKVLASETGVAKYLRNKG